MSSVHFKQLKVKAPAIKKSPKVPKPKSHYKKSSNKSWTKTAKHFKKEIKSAWKDRMRAAYAENELLEFKQLKSQKFKMSKPKSLKTKSSKYKKHSKKSKFLKNIGKSIKKSFKAAIKDAFYDRNGNLRPLRGPKMRRESVDRLTKIVLEHHNGIQSREI